MNTSDRRDPDAFEPADDPLDLGAIAHDDELIEALRLGAALPAHDAALRLLGALTLDVRGGALAAAGPVPVRELPERELMERELRGREFPGRDVPVHDLPGRELPERELARVIDLTATAGEVRRRRLSRGLIAGGVAAAILSTSGVAAAVTGDPFAPYRAVVRTVATQGHNDHPVPNGRAALESHLRNVDALIRSGDVTGARRLLTQAHTERTDARLPDAGVQNRLAALEAKLARERARQAAGGAPTAGAVTQVPVPPRTTSGPTASPGVIAPAQQGGHAPKVKVPNAPKVKADHAPKVKVPDAPKVKIPRPPKVTADHGAKVKVPDPPKVKAAHVPKVTAERARGKTAAGTGRAKTASRSVPLGPITSRTRRSGAGTARR